MSHHKTWWRHQMETFSVLLAICAGNSPVPGEFPTQRPVTRSFDVYFDLRPNKRLSKQSWGWWFAALWCPSWRHRNEISRSHDSPQAQYGLRMRCRVDILLIHDCLNSPCSASVILTGRNCYIPVNVESFSLGVPCDLWRFSALLR